MVFHDPKGFFLLFRSSFPNSGHVRIHRIKNRGTFKFIRTKEWGKLLFKRVLIMETD